MFASLPASGGFGESTYTQLHAYALYIHPHIHTLTYIPSHSHIQMSLCRRITHKQFIGTHTVAHDHKTKHTNRYTCDILTTQHTQTQSNFPDPDRCVCYGCHSVRCCQRGLSECCHSPSSCQDQLTDMPV